MPKGIYKRIKPAPPPWNKGLTKETSVLVKKIAESKIGLRFSEETKRKMSLIRLQNPPSYEYMTGEKHWNWRGGTCRYNNLHIWVRKKLGKANCCWICETKTAKVYDWANISGLYTRDLQDWLALCRICHKRCDKQWFIPLRKMIILESG